MLKELFISCYLFLFRLVFNFCKVFPQKRKIVFVVSFAENAISIQKEMKKENVPFHIVTLCKPSLNGVFQRELDEPKVIPFEVPSIISWCKAIYHLSTARFVIIDNYFAFLSVIKFKKNVECIQVWHAAGALKKFGLKDQSISNRMKSANKRFRRVYKRFDKIIVGSDEMAKIFIDAFDVSEKNILRTGIPRTDFFYDNNNLEQIKLCFFQKYPSLKGKKLILYAPTFRDDQLTNYSLCLDIGKMFNELNQDYVLLIKLHPAVKTKVSYEELYPEFVFDFSSFKSVNELLVIVDYLITDYSSIPFEYALLQKPMIFFPYDLKQYQKQRGVIPEYLQVVPGPVTFQTDEIINLILNNTFNLEIVCDFANKWNKYSNGDSSEKFVKYIKNRLKD